MGRRISSGVLALAFLLLQLSERAGLRAGIRTVDPQSPDGQTVTGSSAVPIETAVISSNRLDPAPRDVPACAGCSVITVVFSVTCTRLDGCENLTVMEFHLTYESDAPVLFYGDEYPNAELQGTRYAGLIYGAQQEFPDSELSFGATTIGSLSFTLPPGASHLVFHYARDRQYQQAIRVGPDGPGR